MKKEQIWDHLAKYKKEILNIPQNGIDMNRKIPYPHILPEEMKEKNIIDSKYYHIIIRETVNNNKITLHQGFHHLTSSQALCFNLFFPIFIENKFALLLSKILHKDIEEEIIEKDGFKFEYIEDKKEETNFDLYVKTNRAKYYFEIKYTEPGFGGADNDETHRNKYNNRYKERFKIFKDVPPMEEFFKYYQLFRNLMYNDGYNIFVFPEDRADLKKTINDMKEKYCKEEQQDRIFIFSIEDIVNIMLKSNNNDLIKHYELFSEKYLKVGCL